ncbi:MAG: sigma-54 dependent transcriptional regulator [Rikenellaceae bacterium]
MELQSVKQRFGIIGSNFQLDRAIEIAMRVASTDLSVLITGESGVGKEFFPQIIHNYSSRKHGNYIAVNCGAIPEGTIESELFGHEKGSFTGANEARKGYFEMADGGTIFLDEVAELPHTTQVRLLRVLQAGEFIKVGSSKVQKTNVRVVAATNINLIKAIENGSFREDLYYRLNTVPVVVPALRERKEDIYLLFRRFVSDISNQYKIPTITLDTEARNMLENYYWPGNIRQLKNVAEQISVIEHSRNIDAEIISKYLPNNAITKSLAPTENQNQMQDYTIPLLLELKKEVSELKAMVAQLCAQQNIETYVPQHAQPLLPPHTSSTNIDNNQYNNSQVQEEYVGEVEEIPAEELTKETVQRDAIIKALKNNNYKRKDAAKELFISERTLYRRIKELNIKGDF